MLFRVYDFENPRSFESRLDYVACCLNAVELTCKLVVIHLTCLVRTGVTVLRWYILLSFQVFTLRCQNGRNHAAVITEFLLVPV